MHLARSIDYIDLGLQVSLHNSTTENANSMSLMVFVALLVLSSNAIGCNQYGNDFYLGAMKNHYSGTSRLWLSVSVNGSTPGNVSFTVQVLAFKVTEVASHAKPATVYLPLNAVVRDYTYYHRMKGIHVFTVNQSEYVSVTLYNWQDGSVGDYLALPSDLSPHEVSTLHELQFVHEYVYSVVSTQSQKDLLGSQVLLIGCHDSTMVTVTPSHDIQIPLALQDPVSPPLLLPRGESHSFVLNAGETLLLHVDDYTVDITGTMIRSSQHVSVVSGHECGNIPNDVPWCEHLVIQVPPAHTWGYEHILVPLDGRLNGQYFKVVGKHKYTQVVLHCNNSGTVTNISMDQHTTFFMDSSTFCHLSSNKPILLVQLALSSKHDGIGDPNMIYQSPIQQYSHSPIVFEVLSKQQYMHSYITVITHQYPYNITFDGVPILSNNFTIVNDSRNRVRGYYYRMSVEPGVHILMGTGPMTAMVYGFQPHPARSYGHTLSYELNMIMERLFVSFINQSEYHSVHEDIGCIELEVYCQSHSEVPAYVTVKTIPPVSSDFMMPYNATIECLPQGTHTEIYIDIVRDALIEEIEKFQVILESDEDFDSSCNTTTIVIHDDDYALVGFYTDLYIMWRNGDPYLHVPVGIIKGTLPSDESHITLHFILTIQVLNKDRVSVCNSSYNGQVSYSVQHLVTLVNLTLICGHNISRVGDTITVSFNSQVWNSILVVFTDGQHIKLVQQPSSTDSIPITSGYSTTTAVESSAPSVLTTTPVISSTFALLTSICIATGTALLVMIIVMAAMIVVMTKRKKSLSAATTNGPHTPREGAVNPMVVKVDLDIPDKQDY